MPHDDFFEATLIEFTEFTGGEEKTIAKYKNFEELPFQLRENLQSKSENEIFFNGKKWNVLDVNRDLRAHGKGTHVKVRLEKLVKT